MSYRQADARTFQKKNHKGSMCGEGREDAGVHLCTGGVVFWGGRGGQDEENNDLLPYNKLPSS